MATPLKCAARPGASCIVRCMEKVDGHTKQARHGRTRRHLASSIVIATAVVCAAAVNAWIISSTQQRIDTTKAESATFAAASDKAIASIKAAKLKARQEADAKTAADQAATATDATASTVDSSKCNVAKTHANPSSIDVVVNKTHCMQPVSYAPQDLVTSNGATLSTKAINAYNQLYMAAAAAGQSFYVTSSYRSYSDQVSTYAYWVSTSGQNGADTYSARPGYSEHQTGLAFDVAAGGCVLNCFGTTPQYAWLQDHAADYGFIQRYYKGYESVTGYDAEEWHYRYVGVNVAKDMQKKGVKTLEQYWNISGGNYY
jgi:D-alanyl-D-alanine carboxypeptidase